MPHYSCLSFSFPLFHIFLPFLNHPPFLFSTFNQSAQLPVLYFSPSSIAFYCPFFGFSHCHFFPSAIPILAHLSNNNHPNHILNIASYLYMFILSSHLLSVIWLFYTVHGDSPRVPLCTICSGVHVQTLICQFYLERKKNSTTLKSCCLYEVQTTTWVFSLRRRERMTAKTLFKVWLVVNDSLKIMVCEWTSSHAFYIWHDNSHKGCFLLCCRSF